MRRDRDPWSTLMRQTARLLDHGTPGRDISLVWWAYLRQLLNVFVKWWWAAVTGVASILSWFALPNGLTLGRFACSIAVFAALTLVLLTVSVTVQAYGWYASRFSEPTVLRFIPKRGPTGPSQHTFVIQAGGWTIRPGYLLSLYRDTEVGEEVCVAVVRVDRERHDDGYQCVPVWISELHLRDLHGNTALARNLRVRREFSEQTMSTIRAVG